MHIKPLYFVRVYIHKDIMSWRDSYPLVFRIFTILCQFDSFGSALIPPKPIQTASWSSTDRAQGVTNVPTALASKCLKCHEVIEMKSFVFDSVIIPILYDFMKIYD